MKKYWLYLQSNVNANRRRFDSADKYWDDITWGVVRGDNKNKEVTMYDLDVPALKQRPAEVKVRLFGDRLLIPRVRERFGAGSIIKVDLGTNDRCTTFHVLIETEDEGVVRKLGQELVIELPHLVSFEVWEG